MPPPRKVGVLFVCTGNICRSPTAESVFAHYVAQAGLVDRIEVDSAGTIGYHEGAPPDPRSQHTAEQRGYSMAGQRARMVVPADFSRFDLLLAMSREHERHMRTMCPADHLGKVRMFLDFAPHLDSNDVPDPYYGGPNGFDQVLDLIEAGADGLLDHIRKELL